MSETKSPHDFICDGVLNYGVDVGRFVFSNTKKTVYAISDLPHIVASDVLMFYQISRLNYQRLLDMSLPNRIPEPPVPASVTEPCRRRFLCGESAYCKRNAFTVFQADSTLIDDTGHSRSSEPKSTGRGLFRVYRDADATRPLSADDRKTGWVLVKAGQLKTLCKGMGYYLYQRRDGKIVCETLCGESIIANSLMDLESMPDDKLESLIYSCEMSRAR